MNPRVIDRSSGSTYDELVGSFRWNVPRRFNIGSACSDVLPPADTALVVVDPLGRITRYTFGELTTMSNRLGNGLRAIGIERGDRVGIVAPQSIETGVAPTLHAPIMAELDKLYPLPRTVTLDNGETWE